MKLWFVVNDYDDGAWLSEDDDSDTAYLSEESAIQAKEALDNADEEAHRRRETQRVARFSSIRAARSILEANGFEGLDNILPMYDAELETRDFESRYRVMAWEVKE